MALRNAKLFAEAYKRVGANTGLGMICETETKASELVWKKEVVRCDRKDDKPGVEGCIEGKEQSKLRLIQERMQILEEHTGYHFDEVLGYVVRKVTESYEGVSVSSVPDWYYEAAGSSFTQSGPADSIEEDGSLTSILGIEKKLEALSRRAVVLNATCALKHLKNIEESIADMLDMWRTDIEVAEYLFSDAISD